MQHTARQRSAEFGLHTALARERGDHLGGGELAYSVEDALAASACDLQVSGGIARDVQPRPKLQLRHHAALVAHRQTPVAHLRQRGEINALARRSYIRQDPPLPSNGDRKPPTRRLQHVTTEAGEERLGAALDL